MNIGIGLALLCAAITQLGFLCKHRGANAVADIDFKRPLASNRKSRSPASPCETGKGVTPVTVCCNEC